MVERTSNIQTMRQTYVENAFIRPADQNYLVARIAFDRSLIFDGYWAAAQATEKYLKAALLLNGCDALNAHKLVALFDKLKSSVKLAFTPEEFQRLPVPSVLEGMGFEWGNNSIRSFIDHLEIYGSPDNRYGRNGYYFDFYVLPKLDQLVYYLRRNCRTLDVDEVAQRDITDWRLAPTMLLECHFQKKEWASARDNQLVDDFLTGNIIWQRMIAGGPVRVALQPVMSWQQSAYGAVIQREEISHLDQIEFHMWLLSNIQLNKADKAWIREHIAELKDSDSISQ